MTRRSPRQIAQGRPAETGGSIGSLVVLGYVAFGGTNPNMAAFLGAAAGIAPSVITQVVNWRRRRREKHDA